MNIHAEPSIYPEIPQIREELSYEPPPLDSLAKDLLGTILLTLPTETRVLIQEKERAWTRIYVGYI